MTADPNKSAAVGCGVLLGFMLAGVAGMGLAAVAGQNNAPFWVVGLAFFGCPILFLAGAVVVGLRRAGRPGSGVTEEQAAAAREAGPLAAGCFVVATCSFGGAIAADALGAPAWLVPVAFLGPPVVLAYLAWPYLRTVNERMTRAAPSPERAAATAVPPPPKPSLLDPTPAADFPTVPPDPSTPGADLARRLPAAGPSAGCGCAATVGFAAFWNGVVSVFVWQAAAGVLAGKPEWFLILFLIPFVLVGLAALLAAVLGVLVWAVSLLAGAVVVEVDAHPFVPGGVYRGRVTQRGLARLARVGVALAGEEAATYQAGTSESTSTWAVGEVPAEATSPVPPVEFTIAVPADAMHSFAAAKNKVTWTVRVAGRVLGWLPYSATYAAVVRPPE